MMLFLTYIISWFFGLLFLAASIVMIFDSVLGGLILIIISLLLIPPVRYLIFTYTKIKIEVWGRLSAILLLLVILVVHLARNLEPSGNQQIEMTAESILENEIDALIEAENADNLVEELKNINTLFNN